MINLSINDDTQAVLKPYLQVTEQLLLALAKRFRSRRPAAQVVLAPDLGLPHNVRRLHGGFATGMCCSWASDTPFVPIDTTMNVDTVSIFRVPEILSEGDWRARITNAESCVKRGAGRSPSSSYVWNWAVGNHFITYGRARFNGTSATYPALVLHSSASEFKAQHNGLYPQIDNWYSTSIEIISDDQTGRIIRYVHGDVAERFYELTQSLVNYNAARHRYVAELIAGVGSTREVLSMPHYGMPAQNVVCLGCQWADEGEVVPLLTGPDRPIYFIRVLKGKQNRIDVAGSTKYLLPHGLGKRSKVPLQLQWESEDVVVNGLRYGLDASMANDDSLELRDVGRPNGDEVPKGILEVLSQCPGEVVGRIDPVYSYARGTA